MTHADLAVSADKLLFELRSHRRDLVAAKTTRDRLRVALAESQVSVESLLCQIEQDEAALLAAVAFEAGESLT